MTGLDLTKLTLNTTSLLRQQLKKILQPGGLRNRYLYFLHFQARDLCSVSCTYNDMCSQCQLTEFLPMPPFLGSHKAVFSRCPSNSLVCYQLGPQLVNLWRCDWMVRVFSSSVGLPIEFIGKRTIRRCEPGWLNECLWRGHGCPETLSIPLVWNKQPCSIMPFHHSPVPLHKHRNKTEPAKHGSQPEAINQNKSGLCWVTLFWYFFSRWWDM